MAKARARTALLHHDTVEKLARLGYAAKGVVYVLIGWLAAQAAFGSGGRTTGSKGALQEILQGTYGEVLLGIVAVGFAGYALWRFVQCFKDADNEGSDAKGLAIRAAFFASGVAHVALTVAAVEMLTGNRGSAEGSARSQTAQLMSEPAGRWLVAGVGLVIVGVAVAQFVRAHNEKFMKRLALSGLGARARTWVRRSGKLGFAARGVVFGIIGGFLLLAAYQADPSEAKGLGEALRTLQQQPYGPYLLFVVAAGLLLYGLFECVEARYRVIAPS
jgi:hypothetical protein